jgi:metal-dependent amidase/aminoacylase/carboxypeptidase family protein
MPYKAGVVGVKRGLMASAADSFKITIYGRGGHASQPHRTIDPVVVAAGLVVRLQTIVSRECPPGMNLCDVQYVAREAQLTHMQTRWRW